MGAALSTSTVAVAEEPPFVGAAEPEVPSASAPSSAVVAPSPAPLAVESSCQQVLHPSGRVAAVLCGPAKQPLRLGGHRFEQLTGTLLTYYAHGGVHELLTLRDGFLDGVVETYDPVGHLIERVVFAKGEQQDLGVPPQTASPSAAEGETPTALPPVSVSPEARPSRADAEPELGLGIGLRAGSSVSRNAYGTFLQLGPALDVLARIMPRLSVELRAEFQHTVAGPVDYRRIDVPVTLGLRVELGRSTMRPYVLAGLGPDYAWRKIPGDIAAQPSESTWLLDAHAGFGLLGRVSQRVTWLAELRLGGRFRTDDKTRLRLTEDSGAPVELLGNQFTAQLGLGLQWMP